MMRFTTLTPLPAFARVLAAPDAGRGVSAADPVAEIVTFRLVDGSDASAFAQAADGMTPFLRGTGAMVTRTLSVDQDGLWTDHITWTSMQAAKRAAEEMMTQPEAAPFMQMIDPGSVQMRHAPIRVALKQE